MSSSVDSHTIPPFYACYLMRSYATNSSCRTYIGSTPDPIRRKKQHNGILTQGAHKTRKGRPWETQMIVWGFPSKIAALQFEWAWQKPYLSRHLRTHRIELSEAEAGSSSTPAPHVALPIFTDTPKGQVITSADGCTGLSTHSVQSCILVARALMRSEPFSAWGLRVTFFEEYCWAAWCRLEAELVEEFSRKAIADVYITVGLRQRRSRLGRHLPADHLSPAPTCEFSGVDGSKKTLLSLTEEEKKAMKLGDEKPRKEGKKGRSPGQWPEKLAQSLTPKAMGATWKMLKEAPQVDMPISVDNMATDRDNESRKSKWNDDDLAELSWLRYLQYLKKEAIDWTELREGMHQRKCYLCQLDIKLQDHLTYTSCPSPFLQLQPRAQIELDTTTPTLSQFGFHKGPSAGVLTRSRPQSCENIFHISCLARHFSKQSHEGTTRFVLPTQGCCPCCSIESRDEDSNTWINIIRSVYRRKERLEREYLKADAVKIREKKLALKASTKKRPAATKSKVIREASAEIVSSAAIGLLDALDELQSKAIGKRGTKQVVSSLLRDPIQPTEMAKSTKESAKRASLLCSLDNLLNIPSQEVNDERGEPKRSRSVSSNEIIDLT